MAWFVVQAQQLTRSQRERSVRFAGVVAKFNFVHARRQIFHDRAHLSPQKAPLGNTLQESHQPIGREGSTLAGQNSPSRSRLRNGLRAW